MKKSYFIKLLWPLFLVGSLWGSKNHIFKIVLAGPEKSGKTALCNRSISDKFSAEHKATIGVDFFTKELNKDTTVTLQIWNTSGEERFESLFYSYYKEVEAVILCYDITDKESFKTLNHRVDILSKYANIDSENPIPLILCGTKSDLKEKRQVSEEEGEKYADKVQTEKEDLFSSVTYIETSAKNNTNVETLFKKTANLLLEKEKKKALESDLIGGGSESDPSKNEKVEKNAEDNSITNFFKDHWKKLLSLVALLLIVISFLSEDSSIEEEEEEEEEANEYN